MGLGDPRVLFPIFDMSYEAEPIPKSYIAVYGQASRGPLWNGNAFTPADVARFIATYGNSVDWTQDPLQAIKALQYGANIVFHRIAHCSDVSDRSTVDCVAASCLIADRGGNPSAARIDSDAGPFTFTPATPGQFTGSEIGPYEIVLSTNDAVTLRVGTVGSWGEDQAVTLSAATAKTAQAVCDEINAQTEGINATVVDGKIHVEAVTVGNDIEVLAVTHDAYSALGLSEGISLHSAGTDSLVVAIDGAADQTFQLVPAGSETGAFILTAAQVALQIAAITGGTANGNSGYLSIISDTTGAASTVQVQSTSTAHTPMGLDNDEHAGADASVKYPWRYRLHPGAYGNGAKFYVYDSPLNPGETMNVRIVVPGADEEYFSELSPDPEDGRYWWGYINSHSREGQLELTDDDPNPAPNNWPEINETGYVCAGGADGTLVLTDADWIGDPAGKTGLYVTDHWSMPFIDIMQFGSSSATVRAAADAFVDTRRGRFWWGPTPAGLDDDEMVAWRMGDPDAGYQHAAFNMWKSGMLADRVTVFDPKNNENVEITGLPALAAAICKTDQGHGRHWSPFGVENGAVPEVLSIDYNPAEDAAGADLLAEYQINNVRILHTSLETRGWEGAYLWGGWTSQRAFSALREVPVARKILEYQWTLYPVGLQFINRPNHPVQWREAFRLLNPILRADLDAGAIYGYVLICDEGALFTAEGTLKGAVLNTGGLIDQGIYRLRMLIQPVRQIFYPTFEMGIMRTGQPFSDYRDMFSLPGWLRQAA